MSDPGYSFGPFRLDPADRRLLKDGQPVEVNARYLDALLLMVGTPGRLVSKDRFHDEVWRGIPVTDEALTQCIRTLRRALDDDAAAPQFIETVPRHGYRFIAPVEVAGAGVGEKAVPASAPAALDALAAALGGGLAGIVGALIYVTVGLVTPGIGAASTLIVLISINLLLGLVAGGAIGLGMALVAHRTHWRSAWLVAGGGLGGLVIGAIGHMVGNDLFALLFGRSPGTISGALEGVLLGGAAGGGIWLAGRMGGSSLRRAIPGFATGAIAGGLIALLGGRLMAGSLAALAARFPDSRLSLDEFGVLLGEGRFGFASLTVATVLEGSLFAGCVVAAIALGRRLRGADQA